MTASEIVVLIATLIFNPVSLAIICYTIYKCIDTYSLNKYGFIDDEYNIKL